MQAAGFNRLTTIERRQASGDGFVWVTFKRWWAKKLSGPGSEIFAGSQVLASTEARFIGPWTEGVDPTMRLVDGDDVWNIGYVETDDETGRDYLTLRVAGGTNAG